MRNMFENADVFAAYAEIDLAYYMLQDIIEKGHPNKAKNPIDALIDKQTGHDKIMETEMKDAAIQWLEVVIENKKIIEADYSADERALEALK